LAIFFEDARLKILFQIAALALFVSPLAAVPAAIIKRRLLFKELAIINMCSTFIALFITIIMAINDYGYFSLIAQKLIYVGLNVIFLFMIAKYWPSIKFNFENLKKHLSYGLPILGSKIVNYSIGNLDNFLIGKFMTPVSLGFYSRAFSLVTIPSTRIGLIINTTLFPVFSNMKNKGDDINKTVLILYEIILYVLFLLALLYIVNANSLIAIISPDGAWDSIVPIIQALAIVAIVKPMINFYSSILYSLGLSKKAFKIELFGGGVIVFGFLIGVSFDLMWFSYIYVTSAIIFFIYYSFKFKNTLNLAKAQLFHLSKYKVLSFLIILSMTYLFFFNITFSNPYVDLFSGIIFSCLSWFTLNFLFEKKTTRLILKSIKSIR
jgi:PST family polysaccharide transporter